MACPNFQSMQCYECGCVTSETVRTCPGCGAALAAASSPAASAGVLPISYAKSLPQIAMGGSVPEALGYATMGERFLAFLCDATIEAMLVVAFLAVYYAKSELDFKSIQSTALWVIPTGLYGSDGVFFSWHSRQATAAYPGPGRLNRTALSVFPPASTPRIHRQVCIRDRPRDWFPCGYIESETQDLG